MLKSLVQIKEEFQLIKTEHRQLNNFYWGDFLDAMKREDEDGRRLYKYLIVTPVTLPKLDKTTTSISLQVTVCDKVRKNYTDKDDVQSDCVQILSDIITTMLADRWQEFADVGTASATLFIDKSLDAVAGATMNVTIDIYSEDNQCAIPYENETPLTN